MDEKRRAKRTKVVDDGRWDCSVCTFSNNHEAFKCEMCDVRKGTSTRKPRINPELVAQQVSPQLVAAEVPVNVLPIKKDKSLSRRSRKSDTDPSSPYSDQGSPSSLHENSNSGSNSISESAIQNLKSELGSDPSTTPPAHFSSNSAFVTGKYSSDDVNDKNLKTDNQLKNDENINNDISSDANLPSISTPDNNSLHNSCSVEKQTTIIFASQNDGSESINSLATSSSGTKAPIKKKRAPRLKNIDRSSATTMEVTVGDVTVLITDYKLKKEKLPSDSYINGNINISNSLNGLDHENRLNHESNISNSDTYNDPET